MNPIPMRRVADMQAIWEAGVGAYTFIHGHRDGHEYRMIAVLLPDDSAEHGWSLATLPLRPGGGEHSGQACWDYDGNDDCPTLSPSIFHDRPRGWHGFIRAGQLVQA